MHTETKLASERIKSLEKQVASLRGRRPNGQFRRKEEITATEYILQKAAERAERGMYKYVLAAIIVTAVISFNAGRVYDYAQGIAVKSSQVDGLIQKGLEQCK